MGSEDAGDFAVVTAEERERPALQRVQRLLEQSGTAQTKLVGSDGTEAVIPASLMDAILRIVEVFNRGDTVSLMATEHELTTQEAADLLNVSRPYLVRLLDEAAIPFTRVGTHRRIALRDLLIYKRARDGKRRQGLDRLTRMSREMGLYDPRPDS